MVETLLRIKTVVSVLASSFDRQTKVYDERIGIKN